jgi:hypothetical protein
MRKLLFTPIAVLALGIAPGQPANQPGRPPVELAERDPIDSAVENGLAYLSRSQNRNGSWSMGGGLFGGFNPRGAADGDIAVTSLAVMAFLSAGHVPGEGRHGESIERGIRWVLERQTNDGKLAPMQGFEMYHHGIATLMLAEVVGMTSGESSKSLRVGLEKAISVILAGQRARGNHAGGWRYQAVVPGGNGDSDLSVTGWQLMALRAAKNVGCDLPANRIQAAVGYVKRSQDRNSGGFQYQPGGMVTVPCTGVGVLCLELSGKEYHLSDDAMRGGAFLQKNPMRGNDPHFYYGVYYVSQAMFQLGGPFWQQYRPKLHELLLRQAGPAADGSWGSRGGDGMSHGPAYATAMAILAITVEYRYLPIYQRFEEPLERD